MAGRLVTIATFDRIIEARLAQSALEAAGIQAVITEDDTSPVLGQFTVAATGIQVLVREDNEEQAMKVLDETFEEKPLDEEELAVQAEAEAPEDPADAAGVIPPQQVIRLQTWLRARKRRGSHCLQSFSAF